MTNAKEIKSHLGKNLAILSVSIGIAVILWKIGVFERILGYSQSVRILGSFIAGFFFTSVLTVGPAMAAIIAIVKLNSVWEVAVIGAIGSVLGDLILFRFVRERISDDFVALFDQPKIKRLAHILHLEIFRFLTPFIGALIVASPLPDEIGLAMMGISKIKTRIFIPLSYVLNFLGILAVGFGVKLLN